MSSPISADAAARAAAAEAARRAAEAARRRAEEQARQRAEAQRQQAEKAKQAAQQAQEKARAQQAQADKARRDAQTAPKPERAQAERIANREQAQADRAELKAQKAREEHVIQARQAEDAMRAANTEAAAAGSKRPVYSERQIHKVQPSAEKVADVFSEAGRRRSDFAEQLGLDPATEPNRVASVLKADREYARLAQDPDTAGVLERFEVTDGASLHDFGRRVAREALGGEVRADDVPLSELKDGFKNAAVSDVLRGAGASLPGEAGDLLRDPAFGKALAEGRTAGKAAELATGLEPAARAGLERMGVSPDQYGKLGDKQQAAYLDAARALGAEPDQEAYEAAIGALGEAGPNAASTITSLAGNLEGNSPAAQLLRNEESVKAMLRAPKGPGAIDTLAADGDGAHLRAIEAMGEKTPRAVIDQLAATPEVAEGLREMGLLAKDLHGAGAALPALLRAAETDSTATRMEQLTAAIGANPKLDARDAVLAKVVDIARNMEPGDPYSELELKILGDPQMVESLANRKNAGALAVLGEGQLSNGLGEIKGPVPKKIFDTVIADENFSRSLEERTGIAASSLGALNGKALGQLAHAAFTKLDDPPSTEQAKTLLGHLTAAAAAGNPALREQLGGAIVGMTGEGGKLADLPDSLKGYVQDPALVRSMFETRNGVKALNQLATGTDAQKDAAAALELLGDKAPPAFVQQVIQQNEEELTALGIDVNALDDSPEALRHLLLAADVPGDSADNPDINPTAADGRLPHLIAALATDPESAALADLVVDNAAAASSLPDSPAHYKLLADRDFVTGLAANKQALRSLGSDDPSAAFGSMKPAQLKQAVEVMGAAPEFNASLQEYGLTRRDLLNADPAALPHLLEAATSGDARSGGKPDVLAKAVAADPSLAPKLAGFIAASHPGTVAADVFADKKLVAQLARGQKAGEVLAELMMGHPGNAIESLGDKVPPELAKVAWTRLEEPLSRMGLSRKDFLESGAAMGDLVQSLNAQLEPEEQARELASALGHTPSLAPKLAGQLARIGGEIDSASGEILSDVALVEKLAGQKGGAKALAAIARGEWMSGLTQIEDKGLRGKAIGLAAQDPDFAQGMRDLDISEEQLRTAGTGELTTLLGRAQAARDVNELEQMREDGASPKAISARLKEMAKGSVNPAYLDTLISRGAETIKSLGAQVTEAPWDSDLSDDEIQSTMENLSALTEGLSAAQQDQVVSSFAEGFDPEAIQDNYQFMTKFRHAIEQGGGITFAVKLADEIKGTGFADEADHLHDQISDALDDIHKHYDNAVEDYQHYQNQLENITGLTDDPAGAEQQAAELREEYSEVIAEFEDASKKMLSAANGAAYFTEKYDDDDLDGDADETLDNAHKVLEQMDTALQTRAGQEFMEGTVAASAAGASTFLDRIQAVSDKVEGFTGVADKIATTAAAAMAIKMQKFAEAGDIASARRMGDFIERHPDLYGLSAAEAGTYRTTLLAASGDVNAATALKFSPDYAKAEAALLEQTGSATPEEVASSMLAKETPGQRALAGSLKAVGLVASGIGVAQGVANWGDASTTERLNTVWSGVEFGTEGAAVLGQWATRMGELAETGSQFSKLATGFGSGLTSTAGKVGTALSKLGPVGALLSAGLSAQSAIDQFQSGETAQGIVTAVAGASNLGLAGIVAFTSFGGPAAVLAGIGIAAGAAVASKIIDSIGDGNSEEEVRDALEAQGINEGLADILSNQTGDRIGIAGVIERLADESHLSPVELIEHWNEMGGDDDRIGELEDMVYGYTYGRSGQVQSTMHRLLDDNDGDAGAIPASEIHAMYLRMREAGLVPTA